MSGSNKSNQLTAFEKWWYDAWPHRLRIRRFVPRFLRDCPEPFRGEVLEVGSGGGWTSRQILETFPQVELTAIDIDRRAINKFNRWEYMYGRRLKHGQADVMNLPFDRASFDIVIAINLLRYLYDMEGAIRQLIRVVRPGGLIGMGSEKLARNGDLLGRMFFSRSYFEPHDVEKVLHDEGCEIIKKKSKSYYYLWAQKPHPIKSE